MARMIAEVRNEIGRKKRRERERERIRFPSKESIYTIQTHFCRFQSYTTFIHIFPSIPCHHNIHSNWWLRPNVRFVRPAQSKMKQLREWRVLGNTFRRYFSHKRRTWWKLHIDRSWRIQKNNQQGWKKTHKLINIQRHKHKHTHTYTNTHTHTHTHTHAQRGFPIKSVCHSVDRIISIGNMLERSHSHIF